MRRKVSPLGMFISGFVKSFFIIGILFLVGFGSYKLTMWYYQVTEPPKNERVDELLKDAASDGIIEDISKNLIFAGNGKTGEITNLVLEVFNTYTYNVDYITIPVETQFTLSNEAYQKMCAENPDIPQIIRLSDLGKYFKTEHIYENGIDILKDLIDVNISYYTQMEESYFHQIFTEQDNKETLSDSMMNTIANLTTEEDIKNYLEDFCENTSSNLNTNSRLKYSDSYGKVKSEAIYFHKLPGEKTNSGFEVDVPASNQLLSEIIYNEVSYGTKQEAEPDDIEQVVSSKEYGIQILNGSKISGLAAEYKSKLAAEGYNIQSVGNYSGETLSNTKIIVSSSKLGKDLAAYFKEPVVVQETLPESIDIQIIIGTIDKIN